MAEKIGKYELIEKLGQGGMGTVYKARDPLIGRIVAIKTITASLDSEPELRARFFREAQSAGQLSHKNIITIYELGEDGGRAFLAMEFLDGEDLKSKILRADPMTLAQKLRVMVEVCEGLAHAHGNSVVHRDIKPANIFLTRKGETKILDFGLARMVSSDLTKSGLTMGTPNYMSPEQVRGQKVDHRADIFSTGVVFYELLTYRKPFDGDSFASIIYKILQEEPDPIDQLDASLPPELADIVHRAMEKDREERYQHVTELLDDLEPFRPSRAGSAPSLPAMPAQPVDDRARVAGQTPLPGARSQPRIAARTAAGSQPASAVPQPAMPAQAPTLPPPVARSARATTYTGIAAGALIVVGLGAWFTLRGPDRAASESGGTRSSPPAITATTPDANPAADPVVSSGLQAASAALEARRFADAARAAQSVLDRAPGNTEAQNILRQAQQSADSVARGNQEARALYTAGKYSEAARAVGEVLKISPGDQDAQQLAGQLDQFALKSAEPALAQMRQARIKADAARAAELAPRSYQAARSTEAVATHLYSAKQFGQATAKLFEASGLYRSAEIAARTESERAENARTSDLERQAGLRQQVEGAQRAYDQERQRAEDAAADTRAADRFREARRLASDAQAKRDRGDFAGARQDYEAASDAMQQARRTAIDAAQSEAGRQAAEAAARRQPAEPPPTASVPAAGSGEAARQAIAALLGRYRASLEAKNLATLKDLWPGLGGAQENAIREEFRNARTLRVDLQNPQIQLSGESATVVCRRNYQLTTVDGHNLQSSTRTTLTLRRSGTAWVIEDIRHEAAR